MISLKKLGYFSTTESAQFLGISRQKFHDWINKGYMPKPALKQRGITLWHTEDIAEVKSKIGGTPYNGNKK